MPTKASPNVPRLRPTRRPLPMIVLLVAVAMVGVVLNAPVRAVAAQGMSTVARAAFMRDFRTVFASVVDVLRNENIPVSLASPDRGMIRTGSVPISQHRLRQLVAKESYSVVDKRGQQGGRFVLEIVVASPTGKETDVAVKSMVVMTDTDSESPAGGQVLRSSGLIEREIITALTAALKNR